MEKIGVLQVELFNNPDKVLEKQLEDLSDKAGNTYKCIKAIHHEYEQTHKSEFEDDMED